MEKGKPYDVVKLVNILDEDFAYKWDGEQYEPIAAGAEINLPRFLADYVVKKLTDRAIIKAGKHNSINDKRVREEYGDKILAGVVKEYSDEKLSTKEKVEKFMAENEVPQSMDAMTMAEVRNIAKEKGIKFKMTDKKVDLIKMVNGQD